MGIPVLVMGESGSGKTYSIKNFNPKEVAILSVEKGRLPFKNAKDFMICRNAGYGEIMASLKDHSLKRYVIDDSQYLLVNEMFDRVNETGYKKYSDMAVHFRDLVHYINKEVPDDVIVYFLHHTDFDKTTGRTKAKTVGQMIDQYLTLEGCFDIVLIAMAESGEHLFLTQSDGYTTAKSPEEMFELKIPNDLDFVDKTIREYYGLTEVSKNGKKN